MERHSKGVGLITVEVEERSDEGGLHGRLWVTGSVTMHAGPAAPCGKPGNPKCGDTKTRAAGLSKIAQAVDALALTFGTKHSILDMTGKKTILDLTDSTTDRLRLEHAAGILIDSKGVPRFTGVLYGDLDSVDVQPAVSKEAKPGDKLVGTIHSHPGSKPGDGGEHFSKQDIEVAKKLEKDNRGLFHKDVGALLYLLTSKANGGKVLVYDVKRDMVTVVGVTVGG
jgi:hypothetical protein